MLRSPPEQSSNPRPCDCSTRCSITELLGYLNESDLSMACEFKEVLPHGLLIFMAQKHYSSNRSIHSTGAQWQTVL